MRNMNEFKKTADAIVIGGGCIGLTVALDLGLRGLSVTVVERGRPGAEASHAAAGMLAPQAEADCADAFFELACAGRDRYPAFAEKLREWTGIDIELDQTGTLYLAFSEEDDEELEKRYQWQSRAHLNVQRLAADVVREVVEPRVSPHVRMALRFPSDMQVENRRLVTALMAAVQWRGGRVLPGTEVTSLRIESGRITGVETSRGPLSAPVVVVAAGAWTSFIKADYRDMAPPQVEPVRGQVLCFEARPPLVRHVVYSPRGYLVPRRDGRLLAGTTTEHAGFDKSVTGSGIHAIMTHALEIAPAIGDLPLVDAWAGLRPGTKDTWPVIGPSADVQGLYYATGHYRNGILLAPITGELIAEMVMSGTVSPLLKAFTPERFRRVSVGSCG